MLRSLLKTFLFLCTALAAAAEVLTPDALSPTRLRFGSVSLYSENDKYFAGTDEHYTNGFKFSANPARRFCRYRKTDLKSAHRHDCLPNS